MTLIIVIEELSQRDTEKHREPQRVKTTLCTSVKTL